MYGWQALLTLFSKPVKGIKQFHHFSFTNQVERLVVVETHVDGPSQVVLFLVGDVEAVPCEALIWTFKVQLPKC